MTGSAGGSRSGFDWRSALLMAVLSMSFLAGRISASREVQRLRSEIWVMTKSLHAAQEQYAAAAGFGEMHLPGYADTGLPGSADPAMEDGGQSQTVARSRGPHEVVE